MTTSLASRPDDTPLIEGFWSVGWLKELFLVGIVALIWFGALLGLRPLSVPDEGRYTEIPREMAISGDYVTPRLNGVKYFEKPPLVYWLSALTFRAFGVNEFTARLAGAVFAALGVMFVYITGRLLYGRVSGLWSAIILATSALYYALSQIILLDMAVAATMSGALFAFILGVREPRRRRRFLFFMGFYGLMALATLSKGLIGIAIPGAVIFFWVLLLNRWRALLPFYPIVGTVVLLAIAGPWHYLAARANPDFLRFYFVHEHFLRFTTRVHGRYEPWWFFLPFLIIGPFPWIAFALQSLRERFRGGWKAREETAESWFFVIWILFVLLFFSKSQSKLVPYILPILPAFSVLFGPYLARLWEGQTVARFRGQVWGFLGVVVALLVGLFIAPQVMKEGVVSSVLKRFLTVSAFPLGLGAVFVFQAFRRDRPRAVLAAMTLTIAALWTCALFAAAGYDKKSTKELCMMLAPRLKSEDRVYSVGFYGQDMPVYLNRLVSVVDSTGELRYGIEAEPERMASRFLDRAVFINQWTEPAIGYAIMRRKTYDAWFASASVPHEILGEDNGFVLAVNHPSGPYEPSTTRHDSTSAYSPEPTNH